LIFFEFAADQGFDFLFEFAADQGFDFEFDYGNCQQSDADASIDLNERHIIQNLLLLNLLLCQNSMQTAPISHLVVRYV
jgi:hypothetical protein